MATKTVTRPYHVKTPNGDRLVEAVNPTQAIRHCVSGLFSAEPAGGKDVAALMARGAKYEIAGEEPAELPLIDANA